MLAAVAARHDRFFCTEAQACGASRSGDIAPPDKGKFRILADGQQVGKEEFEIMQQGGELGCARHVGS